MYITTAAQQRRGRGEQRQSGRNAEHDDQAMVESGSDQPREELGPGQDMLVRRGERRERAGRSQQVRHRVLTEHRGEQGGHRRETGHVLSDGVRDALLPKAGQQLSG